VGGYGISATSAVWREAGAGLPFKPYSYGAIFDLAADPNAQLEIRGFYMRSGRNALVEIWQRQRDEGGNHVALNPKPLQRPFEDVVDELPRFPGPEYQS
jgi:hypothetical protein